MTIKTKNGLKPRFSRFCSRSLHGYGLGRLGWLYLYVIRCALSDSERVRSIGRHLHPLSPLPDRLANLEVVDAISWELSTRNLGLWNTLTGRASLDLPPVEKSFFFTVSRYTFGHQQLWERSNGQEIGVLWIEMTSGRPNSFGIR
jgi:hypothetical protein